MEPMIITRARRVKAGGCGLQVPPVARLTVEVSLFSPIQRIERLEDG